MTRNGRRHMEEAKKERCRICRHWRPAVLTDSLGIIRGSQCCSCSDPRDDGSCYQSRAEEESNEERDD